MSEDESEFIVVDEASMHETQETLNRLKEVVEMYKSSHDALTKSNILLQEQLHLALQLVLQRVPPDMEIDKEEILNLVSRSVNNCSDSVRDEYVTKLCSKLVAVNENYEKLVKEFEEFKISCPKVSSLKLNLDRLSEILKTVDKVLPSVEISNSNSAVFQISSQATNSVEDDINILCKLAEAISFRVISLVDSNRTKQATSSMESDLSYLPVSALSTTKETADEECETNCDLSNLERLWKILNSVDDALPSTEIPTSKSFYEGIFLQTMHSNKDRLNALCDFADSINTRVQKMRDSTKLKSSMPSVAIDSTYPEPLTTQMEETADNQCEIEKVVRTRIDEILRLELVDIISEKIREMKDSLVSVKISDTSETSASSLANLVLDPDSSKIARSELLEKTTSQEQHFATANYPVEQSFKADQENTTSQEPPSTTTNYPTKQSFKADQFGRPRGFGQNRRGQQHVRPRGDWRNFIPREALRFLPPFHPDQFS